MDRDYRLTIPEEPLDRVPCKMTLEILDLAVGYPEDNSPVLRVLDLPECTFLQYPLLISRWGAFAYHEKTFVDTIEQDLVPFLPPTLSECVVQLRLYYGSTISGRLKGLIVGDLDDRTLLGASTRRVKTPLTGPLRDRDYMFWDRGEDLMGKRRRLRVSWGGRFPRENVEYGGKKPLRKTAKKVAKMAMATSTSSPSDGVRLLSFDGGGIRSITQALMIREIMHRVEEDHRLPSPPKVSDYFDMICGSGLGGLLAIMCGVFHMTGNQLVEEFVGLCKLLFSHDLDVEQRTTKLEQETRRLINTYISGGEERKIISQDNACKTFVCAASLHNAGHPRLFRTYRSRSNPSPDCTICEVIRATTALPGLFNPITIGDNHLSETFVGGELRCNNPTDELTKEAAREFNGRHVACIISIGSGHPGHLSLAEGLAELFHRIALDCERLNDDMERRFGNVPGVFWRLNVEQGLQNLASDLSNLDALVSHTYSYLQGSQIHRGIDNLLVDLVRRPGRTLAKMISGEVSSAPKLVGPKACPPPTQYFTGRQSQLEQLDGHFNSGIDECHVAVLYGMGGSGKTQIGLEFIRRNKSRFSNIYFIDTSSKLTLENDLAAIAVGSSDQPSVDDAFRILRSQRDEWLLFLDNADDPSFNLRPYISWSYGNVLITTRNRELRVHAPKCSIWVDRLDLEDAKKLLLRGLPGGDDSEEQDIAVALEFGCLALAITQARAFLAKGLCSISEYLPLYIQNRRRLLEHDSAQKIDDYRYSVYTTWTISFKKLSSNAALLLELLSCMHHDAIPSWIFQDAWEVYTEQHKDAVPQNLINFLSIFSTVDSTWDVLRFRTLIGELLSFSLLDFDQVQHIFSLHPLVQEWARSHSQRYQDNARTAQTLLSLATPIGDSILDNMRMRSLAPHLRESIVLGITEHYTLLSCMEKVFRHGGLLRQCHDVCQIELTERRQRLGACHPDTLGSMNNLAITYSRLGQHRNALELNEQVVKLRKRILGEEHPDTLRSMNNLANTYSDLGQHRDALELNEQVVKLRKRILGEEHPSTLASMNNLANTYSDLGQHRDALELKEQVLKLRKRILGEEHPDTLGSMNNLAVTYSDLGQHRDALELKEQVLKLRKRILGEEHPSTLGSMNNLAVTYSNLGQHRDALELKEQVLKLRKRILGEEHPDTLRSTNSIAVTYSHLDQHRDALELNDQVLKLQKQVLGEEHPDTLGSMNNLANTYWHLGQHRDALDFHERTLKMRRRILGQDHPDTLNSLRAVEFARRQVLHGESHMPQEGLRQGQHFIAEDENTLVAPRQKRRELN
ncbi:hypothetical protein DL96DRAFT_1704089 [Flagelloscypha sp. PMI_526]|nr:hypothetical protein DL96DRAFT_1704089 [Flagelloscypha sp. PMI_526]